MPETDHSGYIHAGLTLPTQLFGARLRVAGARELVEELERRALQLSRVAELLLNGEVDRAETANAGKHVPAQADLVTKLKR